MKKMRHSGLLSSSELNLCVASPRPGHVSGGNYFLMTPCEQNARHKRESFKRQEWKFNDMRLNKGKKTEFSERAKAAAECMCARGW